MLVPVALLAAWLVAPPPALEAQAPPVVRLESYSLASERIGERDYIFARGILRNEGPGPATNVQVGLTLWGEDRLMPLGVGGGHGWLDALDVDETGPFSVAINHCCPEDVVEASFRIEAASAPLAPYRALRVEQVREESLDGQRLLAGDLVNRGGRYVKASSLDLYAAFYQGDDLVRLTAANMPVYFDVFLGDEGQSFPPEHAFPWQISIQEGGPAFDRYEIWSNGEPYPAGLYPVPLGYRLAGAAREGADIRLEGEIVHCGDEAVFAAAVVIKAMAPEPEPEGRVIAFTRREFESLQPLPPGARFPLDLTWLDAPRAVDPARIQVELHAIANQERRPLDDFCRPAAIRIFLPSVQAED